MGLRESIQRMNLWAFGEVRVVKKMRRENLRVSESSNRKGSEVIACEAKEDCSKTLFLALVLRLPRNL